MAKVIAESGCEILSDDGNGRVTYALKCNHCGTTDRSTRHDSVASVLDDGGCSDRLDQSLENGVVAFEQSRITRCA